MTFPTVVSVTSGKGGTGKSTVCAGLGSALARRGKRVLIVETDAGRRGLDIMLGTYDRTVYGLDDVLAKSCTLEEAMVACDQEGLFLLSAPANPDAVPGEEEMAVFSDRLREQFDVVLLDGSAGIGSGFRAAAAACDQALVVITPSEICIRDAEVCGRMLRRQGVRTMHLVINQVHLRSIRLNPVRDFDRILDETGLPLMGVLPYDPAISVISTGSQENRSDAEVKPLLTVCFENLAARLLGEERPLAIR